MLPYPDKTQASFVRRMADYAAASAMSQALYYITEQGKRTLLFDGVGALWTERSERATMRVTLSSSLKPCNFSNLLVDDPGQVGDVGLRLCFVSHLHARCPPRHLLG